MPDHAERIASIRTAFNEANGRMIDRLEQLDSAAATRQPATGWNVAQIACHTAMTTEFLSAALSGALAEMSVPRDQAFTEQLASFPFPDRVQTFPALEPPADTTKGDALARLRQSADVFGKALETATAERCGTICVKLPFAVVSIYEVGEFAGGHITRHMGQIDRTLSA